MSKTSVLVVDDDVEVREMVSLALELAGFDALSAAGGAEGLEQARRHRPAAIVMDPALRDVDGIEAARRVRADPELRNIPLIGHSARPDLDRLGLFDAICMKPSPPDALLDRVKGTLDATAPGDTVTPPELRARAVALREQAIALWSAFTRPSMHERLVRLVAEIVDEIEYLKRLRSDAVPPAVRAGVAVLASRVAAFESLLRNSGPDHDGEPAVPQPAGAPAALRVRAAGSR